MSALTFPTDFLWGASTAAYQIEGAAREDGRGPSIWDVFSHTPGKVRRGDTGDIAADHYHRYADDVRLMAELGLPSYRMSVSWPRVRPDGRGPVNQAGLDFYRRLIDALLAAGIEPVVTLYHWDLPQALQEDGGWENRDTASRFAEYAAITHEALGDRVRMWSTLNEPWCQAFLGYASGKNAPGITRPAAAFSAAHHLLLGHGYAIAALRSAARPDTKLSLVLNLEPVRPVDPDRDAAIAHRIDGLANRLFLDPVLRGEYPADVLADAARFTDWSFVRDGDLAAISAPLDQLGVNYYRPALVRDAGEPDGGPSAHPGCENARWSPAVDDVTAMGWGIDPSGLVDILTRLAREYPPIPLVVTETGAAFEDTVSADGVIRDENRVRFLDGYLRAAHQAIESGVDLRGFFVWSLMDNFEWAEGYRRRFGLVHVNYRSQRRTPKQSAYWYQRVISSGELPATPYAGR